jgi:prephenate dehydratase
MNILTLGPAGTFSFEAAQTIFPKEQANFAPNFDQLFDMLMDDTEAIGVVPVENSLHGSIDEILDLLRETDVKVWRMHEVRIRHAFGCDNPKNVTTVASHPQALRQSRAWLKENFPSAIHLPTSSTAAAVDLAKRDGAIGAIASAKLLRESGLTIVSEDIEGDANTTRFGIVSVTDPFPGSERTRMSIAIHPHPGDDRPGLLHLLLTPFKVYDVNLTRIENRPTGKRLGDYNFFVDFVGSPADERTKKVLAELSQLAEIRILGEW